LFPTGTIVETAPQRSAFTDVLLRPRVVIAADGDIARAKALHGQAHKICFVANSLNFPAGTSPRSASKLSWLPTPCEGIGPCGVAVKQFEMFAGRLRGCRCTGTSTSAGLRTTPLGAVCVLFCFE